MSSSNEMHYSFFVKHETLHGILFVKETSLKTWYLTGPMQYDIHIRPVWS